MKRGSDVMNREYEKLIVKNFFNSKVQERIMYELSSVKKRKKALGRFAHHYESILNPTYIEKIPKNLIHVEGIAKLLKEYGAGDCCYVISFIEEIDGTFMQLEFAIEEVIWCGLPCFVSCIPEKLVYFQSEQGFGPPERYILRK